MTRRNSKHDSTLDLLVDRLLEYGYEGIQTKLDYSKRGVLGEFDIYLHRGSQHRYYEVKSTYSRKNKKKAEWQAYRASIAFPNRNWRFILVTPDKVERIEPIPHPEYYKKWCVYRRRIEREVY